MNLADAKPEKGPDRPRNCFPLKLANVSASTDGFAVIANASAALSKSAPAEIVLTAILGETTITGSEATIDAPRQADLASRRWLACTASNALISRPNMASDLLATGFTADSHGAALSFSISKKEAAAGVDRPN